MTTSTPAPKKPVAAKPAAKPATAKKPAAPKAAAPAPEPVVAPVAVAPAPVAQAEPVVVPKAEPVVVPKAEPVVVPKAEPVVTSEPVVVVTPEPVVVAPVDPVTETVLLDLPEIVLVPAALEEAYAQVSQDAKDALEAVAASADVLSHGLQDINSQVYSLTSQTIDDGLVLSQRLLAAKSFQDVVEIQASLAQTQIDRFLIEAPRLGDLSLKLAEEAAAPIKAKLTAALDKLVRQVA